MIALVENVWNDVQESFAQKAYSNRVKINFISEYMEIFLAYYHFFQKERVLSESEKMYFFCITEKSKLDVKNAIQDMKIKLVDNEKR